MKLEHLGRIACQMAAKELDERACAIHKHRQLECSDCEEAQQDERRELQSTEEALYLICNEGYTFSGIVRVLQVPGDSQGGFGLEPLPAESGEAGSSSLAQSVSVLPADFDAALLKIRDGHRATIDQAARVESAIFDITEAVIRAEHNAGIYLYDADPLRMRGSLPDGNHPEEPDYPEESTDILGTGNFIESQDRWC